MLHASARLAIIEQQRVQESFQVPTLQREELPGGSSFAL